MEPTPTQEIDEPEAQPEEASIQDASMEALQKMVVRLQEAHKTTEEEQKVRVPKDVPKKIEEALHAYLHRTYRNPRINKKIRDR